MERIQRNTIAFWKGSLQPQHHCVTNVILPRLLFLQDRISSSLLLLACVSVWHGKLCQDIVVHYECHNVIPAGFRRRSFLLVRLVKCSGKSFLYSHATKLQLIQQNKEILALQINQESSEEEERFVHWGIEPQITKVMHPLLGNVCLCLCVFANEWMYINHHCQWRRDGSSFSDDTSQNELWCALILSNRPRTECERRVGCPCERLK